MAPKLPVNFRERLQEFASGVKAALEQYKHLLPKREEDEFTTVNTKCLQPQFTNMLSNSHGKVPTNRTPVNSATLLISSSAQQQLGEMQ